MSSTDEAIRRASLRFAIVVVAIVAVVLLAGSAALFRSLAANVRANTEGNFATDAAQTAFEKATITRVRDEVLLADAAILLVVAGGGLLFARQALKPVRRNLEVQRQFVANASHELRTPLAVMRADIDVALDDRGDVVGHAATLESNLAEVDRMTRLVDDMLTLSRIDARQEDLHLFEVNLAALLTRTVAKMRTFAATRGVGLTLSCERDAPVRCDDEQLERAFANLIKNAIEHSGPVATVDVSCCTPYRRVVVTVSDRGSGIEERDLPHIFERYYRADTSGRGGSGLGLPIARSIVRAHGGEIAVASAPGQGTTVTVALPAVPRSSFLHGRRVP
jgi:signal transduction histidine kinase